MWLIINERNEWYLFNTQKIINLVEPFTKQ
jgi:hypothetical protein